jgi:TRAP-type C4-dicarboxylate transport system permease small subunit
MHLAIDLLPSKLTGRSKAYLEVFIETCIFIFALVVMVIGGIRLVTITLMLNQISAALQVQLGYVYCVIPLSGVLMMFYSFYFIRQQFNNFKTI